MSTIHRDVARLLSDDMLHTFDERAAVYDRENRFFDDDFDDLRNSGYLMCAVPTEMGGSGLGLDEVVRLQRRLAYHAAPTALGVNMHVYWTGVASDLAKAGDSSCSMILDRAARGDVFAALHGEAGNDLPLLLSSSTARRVDGGWRLDGHKIFGSLSPVWTVGGVHAMSTDGPDGPQIVHAFIERDAPGLQIVDTWDTFGMRATQSQDSVLHDVFVPDDMVALVCPAGFAGAGMFQVAVFAWALLGFSAVYQGIAHRAFDLTVDRAPQRSSVALTRSMAYHPEVQHVVADMRMALDCIDALIERTATDWAMGVAHEDWPVRLVSTRQTVVNLAISVVNGALDVSGGSASFKRSRLEQLFRDANMGRFHPGNTMLAHELIGKLCLGINPDEAPRWG
jgi:alkylation response protein AidB-like acyl-CoA dehydrogenase